MGRLRSSTSAQPKQSTSRPPARSTSVAPATKRTLAGTAAVFVDNDGEKHTYKLSKSADTFVYVVVERHKIFERRCAGDPAPWTTDRIFQECRFTNVFRIVDRDTQYTLYAVIAKGSTDFRERVFRVLLFRLFDRIDTYEFLSEEFGVPTWKGFDRKAYTKALDRRKADGFPLAGHAYQMPAPTEDKIGGSSYHGRLLRLLELMMLSDFADVISECVELCDLQAAIALYPTMNAFLGYQVILDLNMIPQLMLPEDWALPGPGAQKGLHMIFGKQLKSDHISLALSWVHEHFEELVVGAGFSRKDIPSLKPGTPGLSIVDIEHVLCEFSKYVRIASPGKYNCRPFDLQDASPKVTRILPKNWKSARDAFLERNRKYTNPAANKKGEYEISAILDDAKIDGELHYRVRWHGWGPDADTWEPAVTFKKQSPELVNAYTERRSKIEDLLKKYRSGRM